MQGQQQRDRDPVGDMGIKATKEARKVRKETEEETDHIQREGA